MEKQLKPSQVEVDPSQFERAHWKAPERSRKLGFLQGRSSAGRLSRSALWFSGLYSEAKKQAVAQAAVEGVEVLYVCS